MLSRPPLFQGRYLERSHREQGSSSSSSFKGDFYVYSIRSNRWTLIHDDTAAHGGPPLLYDHQVLR